jgi:hypothetical protein
MCKLFSFKVHNFHYIHQTYYLIYLCGTFYTIKSKLLVLDQTCGRMEGQENETRRNGVILTYCDGVKIDIPLADRQITKIQEYFRKDTHKIAIRVASLKIRSHFWATFNFDDEDADAIIEDIYKFEHPLHDSPNIQEIILLFAEDLRRWLGNNWSHVIWMYVISKLTPEQKSKLNEKFSEAKFRSRNIHYCVSRKRQIYYTEPIPLTEPCGDFIEFMCNKNNFCSVCFGNIYHFEKEFNYAEGRLVESFTRVSPEPIPVEDIYFADLGPVVYLQTMNESTRESILRFYDVYCGYPQYKVVEDCNNQNIGYIKFDERKAEFYMGESKDYISNQWNLPKLQQDNLLGFTFPNMCVSDWIDSEPKIVEYLKNQGLALDSVKPYLVVDNHVRINPLTQ